MLLILLITAAQAAATELFRDPAPAGNSTGNWTLDLLASPAIGAQILISGGWGDGPDDSDFPRVAAFPFESCYARYGTGLRVQEPLLPCFNIEPSH